MDLGCCSNQTIQYVTILSKNILVETWWFINLDTIFRLGLLYKNSIIIFCEICK